MVEPPKENIKFIIKFLLIKFNHLNMILNFLKIFEYIFSKEFIYKNSFKYFNLYLKNNEILVAIYSQNTMPLVCSNIQYSRKRNSHISHTLTFSTIFFLSFSLTKIKNFIARYCVKVKRE